MNTVFKNLLPAATTLALSFGMISSAAAQTTTTTEGDASGGLLSTTTTSSTTTIGVGAIAAIIWLVSPSSAAKQVDRYIAANTAEVRQSIAMGAGDATTDLATFFGVSPANNAAFAKMLRSERKTLLGTLSGKRDAAAFVHHIKTQMVAHASLSQDVARYTK